MTLSEKNASKVTSDEDVLMFCYILQQTNPKPKFGSRIRVEHVKSRRGSSVSSLICRVEEIVVLTQIEQNYSRYH